MSTAIKERPILMNGEMVRAVLNGRKTQTRRIIKPQPEYGLMECPYGKTGWSNCTAPNRHGIEGCMCNDAKAPFGSVGDRLYVRENFSSWHHGYHWYECEKEQRSRESVSNLFYEATHHFPRDDQKWVPSIHMPRWASRITLEITDVRVERLSDISACDAWEEGCPPEAVEFHEDDAERSYDGSLDWFHNLWLSINGPGSWEANPWVWVVEFRRIEVAQ